MMQFMVDQVDPQSDEMHLRSYSYTSKVHGGFLNTLLYH